MSNRSIVAERHGIFDATAAKTSIHFGYGLPDPGTFEALRWPEALSTQAGLSRSDLLQYTDSGGLPLLRDRIAVRHGVEAAQVIVTGGASQALQLIGDALLDPDDVVLTEDPSYLGALRIFSVAGARIVQVGMDSDGVDLDALADAWRREPRARMFYTAPLFHNPTGRHVRPERMRQVADLLAARGGMLIQDLVYSELPYDEPAPVPFLAPGGNVINVHSSSKILAPGLRVGWAIADPGFIGCLERLKVDGGVSPLTSNIALALLDDPRLRQHIADLRTHYREKRDLMHAALRNCRFCEPTYELPRGGFSFWVELAGGVSPARLIEEVRRSCDVHLVDGRRYGPASERHVRLAFSYLPPADLERGLHAIDAVYRRAIGVR